MGKRLFSSLNSKKEILNKCPLCGAELEFHNLMQYSDVYAILKSGKLSKKRKRKEIEGSMECGFISCTKCGFHTNCDLEVEDYKGIYIFQDGDKYICDTDEDWEY